MSREASPSSALRTSAPPELFAHSHDGTGATRRHREGDLASGRAATSRCGGATHSSPSDERELENPAGYPARQHRRSLGVCHDILSFPTIRPVAVVLTGTRQRPIHARKWSSGNVLWLLLRCCPLLHAERKLSERGVPVGCAASVRHWVSVWLRDSPGARTF